MISLWWEVIGKNEDFIYFSREIVVEILQPNFSRKKQLFYDEKDSETLIFAIFKIKIFKSSKPLPFNTIFVPRYFEVRKKNSWNTTTVGDPRMTVIIGWLSEPNIFTLSQISDMRRNGRERRDNDRQKGKEILGLGLHHWLTGVQCRLCEEEYRITVTLTTPKVDG